MVVPTKLKLYLINILHFWSIGVRSPTTISRKTEINISTVNYNLKKLKESGNLDRRVGGEQKRKIKGGDAIAIGQYLKRNKELTVKDISMKLEEKRALKASPVIVWRHLKRSGYKVQNLEQKRVTK
jgi:transposase